MRVKKRALVGAVVVAATVTVVRAGLDRAMVDWAIVESVFGTISGQLDLVALDAGLPLVNSRTLDWNGDSYDNKGC